MQQIRKSTLIILLVVMAFMTQAGLVLYTSAFVNISYELHITAAAVKTTLMAYLLGFGVSQLFYGPISDKIGRKKPLLFGMFIFSCGCLWSIFSHTYLELFISRIIQGIGAGSCMTLSRSVLRDCFEGKAYVHAASYLSSGFAIGLGLTPVIGGQVIKYFSWRAEFVVLLFFGAALLIIFMIFLPETHFPEKNRKDDTAHLLKIFLSILENMRFISFLVGGVMAYGVVIAYTTMAPFLFQKSLGYSASFYGWITLFIAIAYYLGTWINRALVTKLGINLIMKFGLAIILLSGISLLTSKVVFDVFNFYVTFIPLFFATLGQALIWSNCIAGALKDLSHIAGTAAALFSCLQMLLSALVSAVVAILHENNQIPLSIVLICLALIAWLAFHNNVFKNRVEH